MPVSTECSAESAETPPDVVGGFRVWDEILTNAEEFHEFPEEHVLTSLT
jgi:hypothetical protein